MKAVPMNEVTENYIETGAAKPKISNLRLFLMAILGGMFTAFSAATTNTAAHSFVGGGIIRLVNGLLFPLGFMMAILLGTELFLGNALLIMPVLSKKLSVKDMIKFLILSWVGNFVGSMIVAVGCALFGQLNISGGQLAVFTMEVGLSKSSYGFFDAIVLGFFCNVLVVSGVLILQRTEQVASIFLAAYLPISLFVICGFENSVANMYYIGAALLAKLNPEYVALAETAGVALENLTIKNAFMNNLIPCTIGNILGGIFIGVIMWISYIYLEKNTEK